MWLRGNKDPMNTLFDVEAYDDTDAIDYSRYISKFLLGGIFGVFSVSLDLDHVLVLLVKKVPITFFNLSTQAGRPFHIPIVILCWFGCFYYGAYMYGLFRHTSRGN